MYVWVFALYYLQLMRVLAQFGPFHYNMANYWTGRVNKHKDIDIGIR